MHAASCQLRSNCVIWIDGFRGHVFAVDREIVAAWDTGGLPRPLAAGANYCWPPCDGTWRRWIPPAFCAPHALKNSGTRPLLLAVNWAAQYLQFFVWFLIQMRC